MSGKDMQDILESIAQCKAEGICARDKIATQYLEKRVEAYERRMQTVNELYRKRKGLPPCPPVCGGEVIEGEVEVVSTSAGGNAGGGTAKRTVKRA
jgi:hypothetical protein